MRWSVTTFMVFMCFSPVTHAQDAAAGAPETGEAAAPAAAPAAQPRSYDEQLLKGHNYYLAGSFEEALGAYNEALAAEPDDQLVQYFIGCSQAKLKRYDEAVVTLDAVAVTAPKDQANIAGKSLFMVAVIEEARGSGDAIKAAWKAYKKFARENPGATTFVASADARLAAYEKKQQLDERYKIVRERIANSE